MTSARQRNPYRARDRRETIAAVGAALGVAAFTGLMIWVLAPEGDPEPPVFPSFPAPPTTVAPETVPTTEPAGAPTSAPGE